MLRPILLSVSVLLALGGGWLLFTPALEEEVTRAKALPVVEPRELAKLSRGSAVLVQGKLVARGPVGPQGFVVYKKQRYLRTETEGAGTGKQEWMDLETVTPPVRIEAQGASVDVTNDDYLTANRPHTWLSDVVPRHVSQWDSTIRLSGFQAGDLVTVDARVAQNGSAPLALEAKALFAGTPAQYLEELRGDVWVLKIVGGVFASLGLVLGGMTWKFIRPKRRL